MLSWGMWVVICLALAVGCGGGAKGNLVKEELPPPAPVETQAVESEDTLAEELSAKRVEELYAKSGIPGWDPSLEEELKKLDQHVKFDVPIHVNKQVRAYLVYFSTERQAVIRRYLSRSTRYLPMIKEVFQEHGLPEDLAYLAMIESGFNPHAYSHAHACGMWQFIKGTGLRYGLALNSYVDERRDPEKATHAAAKYLLDLYKRFGSWYLAAASYNCGEGRVQKELDNSTHKNFWELSANQCLPNETKNYVPQMIAATLIARNPEKFGFRNIPYLPPLQVDKARVEEATSLRAASVAVNVPVEELQTLNPELLRGVTPPDMAYTLNIPKGGKELFARNISLARIEHPAVAERPARVAKGSYKRSGGQERSSSRRSATAARQTEKKGKVTLAKASNQGAGKVTAARKGKGAAESQTGPVTASMLGGGAKKAGANNSAKGKPEQSSKSKAQVQKSGGKKTGSTQVAKKTEAGKNNSGSGKSAAKKSTQQNTGKGKVSKGKGKPLVVSQVK